MKTSFVCILLLFVISSCFSDDKITLTTNTKNVPCKVTKVIDGDTFRCKLNGEEIRVRLIGIDTPESHSNPKAKRDAQRNHLTLDEITKMGKEAYEFTKSLIPEGTVVYLETDIQLTDKYGRVLSYVWLPDGRMLNNILVSEGYAQVYTIPPNVKYEQLFLSAQRKAREEGKGFWKMDF